MYLVGYVNVFNLAGPVNVPASCVVGPVNFCEFCNVLFILRKLFCAAGPMDIILCGYQCCGSGSA